MTEKAPEQCADPELAELFPSYINGQASAEERERIERHLRQCQVCREDLQLLVDMKRAGKEIFCQE